MCEPCTAPVMFMTTTLAATISTATVTVTSIRLNPDWDVLLRTGPSIQVVALFRCFGVKHRFTASIRLQNASRYGAGRTQTYFAVLGMSIIGRCVTNTADTLHSGTCGQFVNVSSSNLLTNVFRYSAAITRQKLTKISFQYLAENPLCDQAPKLQNEATHSPKTVKIFR